MSEGQGLVSKLPPAVRPWVEKAVALATGMSRATRILLLTTAIVLVGGYFAFRGNGPTYTVLFSNLDRDDASAVVAKLKEMKVPYRLEGDGAIIEVPEPQARELRLELAGSGLPRGGAVGFESFDKMKLGATEFEQKILYRRALEGELSRTIGSVAAVQNARVHLVLPERSLFVSKTEPSTASVVVKLRGGRSLGSGEVSSIVHLVATAVSGLSPDHVSVVTTEGAILHRPKRAGEEGASDDERASHTRALEASLEERARLLVEKLVGAGHVDVRVTADIDSSRVERVEDRYDPKQQVLRSEEQTVERTGGGEEIPVAGVPGAESNLPGGAAAAAGDGGAPAANGKGVTREQHTRNFEVDHVTEKRIVTGGVLRRLTVAVVVDGRKEDIARIGSLVRSAVGFDEKRGDMVTVESVAFLSAEAPVVAPPPAPAFALPKEIPAVLKTKQGMAAAGGAAFLVLVLFLVAARRRSKKKKVAATLALAAASEKASVEAAKIEILAPPALEAAVSGPSEADLKQLAHNRAAIDPTTAALVLTAWLNDGVTSATDGAALDTVKKAA